MDQETGQRAFLAERQQVKDAVATDEPWLAATHKAPIPQPTVDGNGDLHFLIQRCTLETLATPIPLGGGRFIVDQYTTVVDREVEVIV